jgi:hypothetical protein
VSDARRAPRGAAPATSRRCSWTVLAVTCAAITVLVGLLAPPLALVGAALLAYCTWRARRERRTAPARTKEHP